ncbi:MAG: GerMN domain-containing protein, partial [Erysipelotrichaceae bacterium]
MKITLKKEMSLILGLICLVLYISIKVLPNPTSNVVAIPKDNMFIYELDNDNLLVPLNIKIDLNLKTEDKLKLMIKKMSNFSDSSFHAILNSDTELLKVNITEGIANLYFNDKLLEINKENELKVLEALSYGCLQFKEINSIRLYVNDKQLTMFKNGTPIADKIDKRIGINNFELSNKYIHDTSNITIYYMKMINNKLYYVPMSKRINNNLMNLKDIANEIVKS